MRTSVLIGLAIALSACAGSASRKSEVVARIEGHAVTQQNLNNYVAYAASFYFTASAGYGDPPTRVCAEHPDRSTCGTMRNQALVRLIEQQIIKSYAKAHAVTISKATSARIAAETGRLIGPGSALYSLLAAHRTSRSFVQSLLTTEALVRRVEGKVTAHRSRTGWSFHLITYSIANTRKGRKLAERIIAGQNPSPSKVRERVQWIAAFRLDPRIRGAVHTAHSGSFVGPFQLPGSLVAVRVLGRGHHSLARPAILAREQALFGRWMAQQVRAAHPICYADEKKLKSCPKGIY